MQPDATTHNPDPAYIRKAIDTAQELHGISQCEVARRIGVSDRAVRLWVAGSRPFPYTVQYAIEQLGVKDGTVKRSQRRIKNGQK